MSVAASSQNLGEQPSTFDVQVHWGPDCTLSLPARKELQALFISAVAELGRGQELEIDDIIATEPEDSKFVEVHFQNGDHVFDLEYLDLSRFSIKAESLGLKSSVLDYVVQNPPGKMVVLTNRQDCVEEGNIKEYALLSMGSAIGVTSGLMIGWSLHMAWSDVAALQFAPVALVGAVLAGVAVGIKKEIEKLEQAKAIERRVENIPNSNSFFSILPKGGFMSELRRVLIERIRNQQKEK